MDHAIGERPTLGDARRQRGAENNETTHARNTPSGLEACRYIEGMSDVTITAKSNGPLIIQGPVRIVTPDGRELTPPPRKDGKPAEVVVLCRCGGSATKPFCDGTHKRNGFQDGPVTTG
jgi:CDGSH-type Zn-finger protein